MTRSVELDDSTVVFYRAWRAAAAEVERWTDTRDTLRDLISAAMGDAVTATVDGQPAVTKTVVRSRRLDTTRLKTERPDIYAEYGRDTETVRVTPAKPATPAAEDGLSARGPPSPPAVHSGGDVHAVTDDQVAALIADLTARRRAPGATCQTCRQPLDPLLAAAGVTRHDHCTPPAPTPPEPAPLCRACRTPLHPAVAAQGIHPMCDEPAPPPLPDLTDDIRRVIRNADAGAARTQQRMIGPSEIGSECDRYLAYKLLDFDPVNTDRDNWLAILGTALHSWLADAFEADNTAAGQTLWIIEHRVWLTDAISGSCDLYDVRRYGVDDHKLLGKTSLEKIRRGNIPRKYRTQLHLYGYGHARAGRRVDTVNLLAYPRNDNLAGEFTGCALHVWTETYKERIALDALARLASVTEMAVALECDAHPERLALIPSSPSDDCAYCPFYRPNAPVDHSGCPGHATPPGQLPTTMPGLIN